MMTQAESLFPPETPLACVEGATRDMAYGDHTTGCTIGTIVDQDFFTFTGSAREMFVLWS